MSVTAAVDAPMAAGWRRLAPVGGLSTEDAAGKKFSESLDAVGAGATGRQPPQAGQALRCAGPILTSRTAAAHLPGFPYAQPGKKCDE